MPVARLTPFVESLLFAAGLAVFAGSAWGGLRTTGPTILLIVTGLAAVIGAIDRPAAARRLLVLAGTLAGFVLLREQADGLIAHRGSRFVLVVGLAVHAMYAVPRTVYPVLGRWNAALSANPDGRPATLTAVFAVALPVFLFQTRTVDHVGAGDTMPVVPTVARMLSAGTRDLSPLAERLSPRWAVYGPGRPYFVTPAGVSAYPAGMELYAAPGVLLAVLVGLDPTADRVHLWVEKLSAAAVAGLSLGLFFLLALRCGPPPAAAGVTAMLAVGSVFTTTVGMLLWQQGGVIVGMLAALLFHARGRPPWAGVACGLMLACRPSAVTFLLPFGGWVLLRDRANVLRVLLGAATSYCPFAALNLVLYDSPVGPSAGQLGVRWEPFRFLPDVLLSPGRGLLVYQPVLWLLAPRLLRRFRSPLPAGWAGLFAVTVGCHLALIGSWPVWWGGACYGSRLVAEVVPLLALGVVGPVGRLLAVRGGPAILLAVGVLGLFLHVGCAFHDAWVWNVVPVNVDRCPGRLWDWSRPPFLHHLFPAG